ncbi:FkbM family methyltransferase [Candidatus Haliotispira prima]|uniref:FkbM family methyltransferase n=1 Tax=Candidatus Haliotispira prima TaxID=3034016 RepID=A0ABY8MGR8_9SPIO|nr:FkbM family methyltransferase [Candidatus Haliotispira prima]
MSKLIKGIKAILGFPFYVYKSYQLQKKVYQLQKDEVSKISEIDKKMDLYPSVAKANDGREIAEADDHKEEEPLDIDSLKSSGVDNIAGIYYSIFFHRVNRVKKLGNKSPLIFDCGAHIGIFSLFCNYLYPNSRIYAYEPDPENFASLKYNTQKYDNIVISNEAISSENGVLCFYSEGSAASSLYDNPNYDNPNIELNREIAEVKVSAVSLKTLIEQSDEKIDLLKIDIEGAEVEALSVCDGILGNVKQIIIEYHDLKTNPNRLSPILAMLENNNFFYYLHDLGNDEKDVFEVLENDQWNMNFILCIHAINKDEIDSLRSNE